MDCLIAGLPNEAPSRFIYLADGWQLVLIVDEPRSEQKLVETTLIGSKLAQRTLVVVWLDPQASKAMATQPGDGR